MDCLDEHSSSEKEEFWIVKYLTFLTMTFTCSRTLMAWSAASATLAKMWQEALRVMWLCGVSSLQDLVIYAVPVKHFGWIIMIALTRTFCQPLRNPLMLLIIAILWGQCLAAFSPGFQMIEGFPSSAKRAKAVPISASFRVDVKSDKVDAKKHTFVNLFVCLTRQRPNQFLPLSRHCWRAEPGPLRISVWIFPPKCRAPIGLEEWHQPFRLTSRIQPMALFLKMAHF